MVDGKKKAEVIVSTEVKKTKVKVEKIQKLIQVDYEKLSKKGWTYVSENSDEWKNKLQGCHIVSAERLKKWIADGYKPNFDGFEAELMAAMKD